MAKFEVCCHKFADLSEADYGVSILNDSKYGFATVGNLQRLSLLRSPKAPDAHADMGRHHIKWAIMPHQGALSSETVRAAYNFNHPLRLVSLVDAKPPRRYSVPSHSVEASLLCWTLLNVAKTMRTSREVNLVNGLARV